MTDLHPTEPQHQLPDFKPKGMTVLDKIAMWTLIFIVTIFTLVQVNILIGAHVHPAGTPTAVATAKPTTKVTANTRYVVINKANGYIWVLDNNGSHFTAKSAQQFATGHPTYQVETLSG